MAIPLPSDPTSTVEPIKTTARGSRGILLDILGFYNKAFTDFTLFVHDHASAEVASMTTAQILRVWITRWEDYEYSIKYVWNFKVTIRGYAPTRLKYAPYKHACRPAAPPPLLPAWLYYILPVLMAGDRTMRVDQGSRASFGREHVHRMVLVRTYVNGSLPFVLTHLVKLQVDLSRVRYSVTPMCRRHAILSGSRHSKQKKARFYHAWVGMDYRHETRKR